MIFQKWYGKPDSGLTCLNLVWPTEVDNGGCAPRVRGRRLFLWGGMIYANLDGRAGYPHWELGELFLKNAICKFSLKIWLRLDA